MKPISLTIEAFGPYRDSVTLDFNELQNHSMFLISGPTGAGKTSILDAMVYALYGEPSGEAVSYTHLIHLNDSKNPMGAHKDRHEKIGEGHIGIDAIARIVTHPKLTNLPFYLETPNELDGYAKEIAMLRSIVENQ